MNLPFTTDQFLSVFEQYNTTVWPLQILLNLLALGAVILAIVKRTYSDRAISAILAFLWLWIGIAYHLAFFKVINPAATMFAVLNVIQGLLFLYIGVLKHRLSFEFRANGYGLTGALLIVYALIVYPILGYFFGHAYPKAPTFGLPCPTTIFTLGLLLWTKPRLLKGILIIPVLWSLIGYSAALTLGIAEDTGLLVSGVTVSVLIFLRDRSSVQHTSGVTPMA